MELNCNLVLYVLKYAFTMAKTGKKVQINLGEILPKVEGFKLILDYYIAEVYNQSLTKRIKKSYGLKSVDKPLTSVNAKATLSKSCILSAS